MSNPSRRVLSHHGLRNWEDAYPTERELVLQSRRVGNDFSSDK